jgi:spore coat protein U-like protein
MSGECLAQSCSVRVTSLQFGDYDPLTGSTLETEADIYVTCDASVAHNVKLDAGANSGGNFRPREMAKTGGAASLDYNIFRDPGRTEIWGDGSNNTFTRPGVGTGAENRFTAYGRLPGAQNVPIGVYSDVVFVLVEW